MDSSSQTLEVLKEIRDLLKANGERQQEAIRIAQGTSSLYRKVIAGCLVAAVIVFVLLFYVFDMVSRH